MSKILSVPTLVYTLLVFLAISFSCCSTNVAQSGGEWRMDFMPAGEGTYAGINVYSTKTGEYYQLYSDLKEKKWKKNPNFPTPPINITKGNLRVEFLPAIPGAAPGLIVYSAATGEWEQFYLDEKVWKLNPNFTSPKVSLPGGDLVMEFTPGSQQALANLFVSCNKTKKFEMLYFDGKAWKVNTGFPSGK